MCGKLHMYYKIRETPVLNKGCNADSEYFQVWNQILILEVAAMPHVIVKLWPGRSEEQKMNLTDKIAQAVMEVLKVEETSVSVSFEEIPKERWTQEVYIPDIAEKESLLYKKPGY